jgi:hypothetical protein
LLVIDTTGWAPGPPVADEERNAVADGDRLNRILAIHQSGSRCVAAVRTTAMALPFQQSAIFRESAPD